MNNINPTINHYHRPVMLCPGLPGTHHHSHWPSPATCSCYRLVTPGLCLQWRQSKDTEILRKSCFVTKKCKLCAIVNFLKFIFQCFRKYFHKVIILIKTMTYISNFLVKQI